MENQEEFVCLQFLTQRNRRAICLIAVGTLILQTLRTVRGKAIMVFAPSVTVKIQQSVRKFFFKRSAIVYISVTPGGTGPGSTPSPTDNGCELLLHIKN